MKNITLCMFVLLLVAEVVLSSNQWIDPHDMNLNNVKSHQPYHHDSKLVSNCPPNFSLQHYKRLISLIVNLVKLDDWTSNYSGRLTLQLSQTDYKYLRKFITESETVENAVLLRNIEQIMNKILTRSKLELINELILTWSDYIYYHFYNRTFGIITCCVFLLFLSYKLLRASFTIWSVMKYLIFIGWVVDFAFTWISHLKDAEIDQLADKLRYQAVPVYCDPSKMSWWQYFWDSLSSTSECRIYHRTMYKDHFWSISPLTVLSHQMGIVIYTPATHIGKAIGNLVSGMMGSLPWGVNIILLPACLVFTLLMVCIILSFVTETSFALNLAYLIQFKFGNRERQQIGDVLSGRNIDFAQNRIEDVRPETVAEPQSKKNETENEKCSCSKTPIEPVASPQEILQSKVPTKADENVTKAIRDSDLDSDKTK